MINIAEDRGQIKRKLVGGWEGEKETGKDEDMEISKERE